MLLAGVAGSAYAATEVDQIMNLFKTYPVVDAVELDGLRGGFSARGLDFEFGANVRTYIDNTLVLETLVAFTDAGPVTGSVANQEPPQTDGNGRIDLSGIGTANGIWLGQRSSGVTAALHQITRERVLSVLVNTADNVASRQEIELNVTIRNFVEFQNAVRRASLPLRLQPGPLP